MQGIANFSENARVILFKDRRVSTLCRQLTEALPSGARVDTGRHPGVDAQANIVLTLQLPARPNPSLPGRLYPASAPFAIEISRPLLQHHFPTQARDSERGKSLAQWIAVHVSGSVPATDPDSAVTPLVWRFTTPPHDISDICVQRLHAA